MIGSELHRAALALAARGIPVFPCVAGTKRPATPHGFLDASTDPDVINGWWEKDDFNVAFSPAAAGWTVLDVDPKNGGTLSLNGLELSYDFPRTYTVRTPSGGLHIYYEGVTPKSTRGVLGDGLDTRSTGGYVLAPPSHTIETPDTCEGDYTVEIDAPIAVIPDWLPPALLPQKNVKQDSEVGLDLPINVDRFTDYMRKQPGLNEGGRNDQMTKYVGKACDIGLSRETALPILYEWCDRCTPPLAHEDVDICGIWTNRQNSGHPLALTGDTLDQPWAQAALDQLASAPIEYERFYPFKIAELRGRPPVEWLIPDVIPERAIGHFYGKTGNYKSFVLISLAMAIAKSRPVIYVVGEGDEGMARRIDALATSTGVEDHQMRVVLDMPLVGLRDRDDVADFVRVLKAHKLEPALVILDTLATAMAGGLDETNARDMNLFVGAMKDIAKGLGCAVAAVHHQSDKAGNAQQERGSSVLRAGVDFVGEIVGDQYHRVASLTMRKQRNAELKKDELAFKGIRVGKELAFSPMDVPEYRELVNGPSGTDAIGRALQAHGHTSYEDGATTYILATYLREAREGEEPAVTENAWKALASDLTKKSKRSLSQWCKGEGKALRWYVPEDGEAI